MNTFSDWLLEQMNIKEWSQSDLARYSGLTRSTISYYLSPKSKNPDDAALRKIAKAFKLPPETIFRAAGLLPQKSNADEKIEQINHLIENLPEEEKQDILEYIKLRTKIAEERRERETENAKRNQRRTASAEGHG